VQGWDAKRYYDAKNREADRDWAANAKLIRPCRVGISRGSCQIAFNPCNPPGARPQPGNPRVGGGNPSIRKGRTFAAQRHSLPGRELTSSARGA